MIKIKKTEAGKGEKNGFALEILMIPLTISLKFKN
jgi:hypothetical protein